MVAKMVEGKVAVLTGAARGIGAATARLLAEGGARLVLADLDEKPLEETAAGLREMGAEVATLTGDVCDEAFPARLCALVEEKFGAPDILINNAGFTWDAILHKMDQKQWDAILAVHLTAPFRLLQTVGNAMREAAKKEQSANNTPSARKVVNISSVSGVYGNAGQANYSTAKAGVIGLTKCAAKEWGRFNIQVNAVAFGWIDTRLTRDFSEGESIQRGDETVPLGIPIDQFKARRNAIALQRPGTADEAAGAIFFLCSPLSDYVTAHVLMCDGGR